MTPERWLPIPGWEGKYEVSDQGRVKALARVDHHVDGRVMHRRELIFKATPSKNGYPTVNLTGDIVYVHRLVLLAFDGPKPDGMETRHLDGVKTNNALSNLRYGTSSENSQDAMRHARQRGQLVRPG